MERKKNIRTSFGHLQRLIQWLSSRTRWLRLRCSKRKLGMLAPTQWAMVVFRTYPKNFNVIDNMCEQFNSKILPLRGKPIVKMLEGIKGCIFSKRVDDREKMLKYRGPITPQCTKKLEQAKQYSGWWGG
ncbi:hypothetical protein SESBI_28831 [Sesbania bispinosa]|nr:hypothetical protein SESBI_28831 [Sesbania bispinosa]